MATTYHSSSPNSDHIHPDPYTPLLSGQSTVPPRRPLKGFAVIFTAILFLVSLMGLIIHQGPEEPNNKEQSKSPSTTSIPKSFSDLPMPTPRGVSQGVSAKSNPSFSDELSYNWTNAMFSWQRTAFHFQPQMNWMNDPDGPLYYMGWYHLFYQYNPDSAVWGNITWGHAVSKDLVHWLYLPFAMVPDQWYDINGVWTGSATFLPDGQIAMLYTGDTNDSVQVQNLAFPANLSDPLLLDWVKYDGNPVISPPNGILSTDFRDPTTAWIGYDGVWRIIIGSKFNSTGLVLVYKTTDFKTFDSLDTVMHSVEGTGMWECVDFYPVAINGSNGLDTSANGPGIKHVLKASLDTTKRDVYAIGTYDAVLDKWTPDNPDADVGTGLEVDYGRYYASKTFYDQNKERRILWGWINETDTESDDLDKGWASVMTLPREVTFDNLTGTNILQWPVAEVETLRLNSTEFAELEIGPGSVVQLDIGSATQLDIIAEFTYELLDSNSAAEDVGDYGCGGGAIDRGTYGPFGLLVIADEDLTELTPIYFRIFNNSDGSLKTLLCADETRSTKATETFNQVYGGQVPVLAGEDLSMRVLVDHSIVESFAQGGRTVITSRVYPTEAIYGAAKLFIFNNATGINVTASLKIWEMNSAFIHPYPLDQL